MQPTRRRRRPSCRRRSTSRSRSCRVDRVAQAAHVVAQRGRPFLRDLHGARADDDAVREPRHRRGVRGRRDAEARVERQVGQGRASARRGRRARGRPPSARAGRARERRRGTASRRCPRCRPRCARRSRSARRAGSAAPRDAPRRAGRRRSRPSRPPRACRRGSGRSRTPPGSRRRSSARAACRRAAARPRCTAMHSAVRMPRASARSDAMRIVGPSASGSENGIPSSMEIGAALDGGLRERRRLRLADEIDHKAFPAIRRIHRARCPFLADPR